MKPHDVSVTDLLRPEPTDPELICRVREGDVTAYGTLFDRHLEAARRLASVMGGGSERDDLVSEAFVKVLDVLLAGGGPDVAFRAYLLTAVRRLHIDRLRRDGRLTTTEDLTPFDAGVPFTDTAVAGFEGGAAAKAFASLPERWQLVLWHLEVEDQKPADVAPLLGISPNSVSALAYRAREGLRQAFLQMHAGELASDSCKEINDLLGGYVRSALSQRDSLAVREHLDQCRRCTAVYLELFQVNSSLAAVLGPALIGTAAGAYLSAGGGAGFGAGLWVLLDRGREAVLGHVSGGVTTAAVIGVAGITALAVVQGGPQGVPAAADQPPARTAGVGDGLGQPGTDGPASDASGLTRSGAGWARTAAPRSTGPLVAGREASASLNAQSPEPGSITVPSHRSAEPRRDSEEETGRSSSGRPATAPTISTPTTSTPTAPRPGTPGPAKPRPTKPKPGPAKPVTGPRPRKPQPTKPRPSQPQPTKPQPTKPRPAKPPRPAEPAPPAEPRTPAEPAKPDRPSRPDRPDRPDRPSRPDKPSKPSKPSKPGKGSGNDGHGHGHDRDDDDDDDDDDD